MWLLCKMNKNFLKDVKKNNVKIKIKLARQVSGLRIYTKVVTSLLPKQKYRTTKSRLKAQCFKFHFYHK